MVWLCPNVKTESILATLSCYTCNTEDDATCVDAPEKTKDCAHVIADLSSTRFRCMTIHAKDSDNKEILLRRCAVSGECKFQINEKSEFEWGAKKYTNAKCEECADELCNKQKLV